MMVMNVFATNGLVSTQPILVGTSGTPSVTTGVRVVGGGEKPLEQPITKFTLAMLVGHLRFSY